MRNEPRVRDLLEKLITRAADGKPIADTTVDFTVNRSAMSEPYEHPVEGATAERRRRGEHRP